MPPSSSTPAISRSLSAFTCARVSAIPISSHQLDAGDARVDRRHRRRPRLEARARSATASSRVCPSRRCRGRRTSRSASAAARSARPGPRPHEAEAGRAEQVLEHAGGEHVDAELPHVERIRADRLVGVEHDERAALVRDAARSPRPAAASRCGSRPRRSRRPPSRSSIASSKRSSGISGAVGGTCTTSAPRSSCACQIWPIVGNSKSLITTFGRCAEVDRARERR